MTLEKWKFPYYMLLPSLLLEHIASNFLYNEYSIIIELSSPNGTLNILESFVFILSIIFLNQYPPHLPGRHLSIGFCPNI